MILYRIILYCTAFDQSKMRTSDGQAGSQSVCELNSRKQVAQCESGILNMDTLV